MLTLCFGDVTGERTPSLVTTLILWGSLSTCDTGTRYSFSKPLLNIYYMHDKFRYYAKQWTRHSYSFHQSLQPG